MLKRSEIKTMLTLTGREQANLFEKARLIRDKHFDQKAIVRGVIEITNACVVNCDYCPMRADNNIERYYLKEDETLEACRQIYHSGIKVVFLQAGEVKGTTKRVSELIPKIKDIFGGEVEILLCLGNKSYDEYKLLKDCGANSYILKHETANPDLHFSIRHETLESRIACLQNLIDLNYSVGTGTIINLPGQKVDDIVEDMLLANSLKVDMVSVSPFIPASDTPLSQFDQADFNLTLNAIAISRILNPRALIPSVSALEKLAKDGQYYGLMAGANVVTVNFSPKSKQTNYLIYGKERFVVKLDHAKNILQRAGLKPDLNFGEK